MNAILHCVIIDDDPEVHTLINGFLKGSAKAFISFSFYKCCEFLNKIRSIEFDLVFLDCFFPNDTMLGVDVALKLIEMNKQFIFISGQQQIFIEACRTCGALDVMPKPLTKSRFLGAINKAY